MDPNATDPNPNLSTAAKLWAKLVTLYGWLGGHPTVATFILGLLAGVVLTKAL